MTDSTHYDLVNFLLDDNTMEVNDTDIDSDEEEDDVIFYAPGTCASGQIPEPEVDLNAVLEENSRIQAQLQESPGQILREKVSRVLECISQEGLDLPTVLDSILWGSTDCTGDARVRFARTSLLRSKLLPGIMQHIWKPLKPPSTNKPAPPGARDVVEKLAMDCMKEIWTREIDGLAEMLSFAAGDDVKADNLTGIILDNMIAHIKEATPNIWQSLSWLARKEKQGKQSGKNPEKVRNTNKAGCMPTNII